MGDESPRIIIEGVSLHNLIDDLLEWERIAKERRRFDNWKRSPIERENRRESIVYGNCLRSLKVLLGRQQVDVMMDEARKRIKKGRQ